MISNWFGGQVGWRLAVLLALIGPAGQGAAQEMSLGLSAASQGHDAGLLHLIGVRAPGLTIATPTGGAVRACPAACPVEQAQPAACMAPAVSHDIDLLFLLANAVLECPMQSGARG